MEFYDYLYKERLEHAYYLHKVLIDLGEMWPEQDRLVNIHRFI